MVRSKFILFFLFFFCVIKAQDTSGEQGRTIDSLRNEIGIGKHDTIQIGSCLLMGGVYFGPNPDSANFYWSKAKTMVEIALSKKTNALVRKRLLAMQAEATNNVGLIKNNLGDVEGAIQDYYKALKIYEQIGDKIGVLSLLSNIGVMYYGQKDYNKAEENYLKSVKIAESINDSMGLASCYNFLGYIYMERYQYEKGLEVFQKALSYTNKEELLRISYIYNDMGIIYYRKKEYETSLENYQKSLEIRKKINDKNGIGDSYKNIGTLFVAKKEYSAAKTFLDKALVLAQEVGYPVLIQQTADQLRNIYLIEKDYKKAYDMYELFVHMKDSIFNQQTKRTSIKSQVKYEYEKKEIELKAVSKAEKEKIELKAAEDKKRQDIVIYAALFGLLGVLIFSFFIYRSLQQNKKKNIIIAHQKAMVEEKQKEVMDSIYYAKRIQTTLLPSEKYIDRSLKDLNKE